MIKQSNFKVNPKQFIIVKSPAIAYILGLLWADGYVYQHKYQNKISLECQKDDFEIFKNILLQTGDWSIQYRHRKNRKEQGTASTNNRPLTTYLKSLGFSSKSTSSACQLLKTIPTNLHKYWFRGLVDGDGCFYVDVVKHRYQFSISSSINQDWTFFRNLLNSLSVKYSEYKSIHKSKNHKCSRIRITGKQNIVTFGKYIYDGFDKDNLGLLRKFKKFKLLNDVLQTKLVFSP